MPKFLAAEAEVLTRQAAVETLAPLATEEHMSSISTSVDAMVAAGQTATGAAAATGLSVQSVVQVEGQIEIRAYGCYDVSGFSIVDASGLSVRAAGVPDRFPVVFEFVGSADGFRSNGSEPWSGANSC
ncbi:hypothetical protein [Pseudoclavibacter helvolus]|uniref:hypothetical protein n=1 Tax=Pseudoclavibacter helvolus TaxID=255205 RepID=UPI003C75CF3B